MADLSAQYRTILKDEFAAKTRVNPKFTQSAFARYLGLDRTYFSKLTAGKILLSLDVAERLVCRMKLKDAARTEFLLSAADEQRCHALYLIDPRLTDCDPQAHAMNVQPVSRKRLNA